MACVGRCCLYLFLNRLNSGVWIVVQDAEIEAKDVDCKLFYPVAGDPPPQVILGRGPTPAGADGHNSTEHKQLAFGFTPPLGWVSRCTPTDSCPTRPATATLTNNALTKQAEKGPKTVKPEQATVLSQVRCLSDETHFARSVHRSLTCQQVRGTTTKYAHCQLLVLSAETRPRGADNKPCLL